MRITFSRLSYLTSVFNAAALDRFSIICRIKAGQHVIDQLRVASRPSGELRSTRKQGPLAMRLSQNAPRVSPNRALGAKEQDDQFPNSLPKIRSVSRLDVRCRSFGSAKQKKPCLRCGVMPNITPERRRAFIARNPNNPT